MKSLRKGGNVRGNYCGNSTGIKSISPLAEKLGGAQLFNLQTGPRSEEARLLGNYIDLAPNLIDFAATATAIQQLDLVISVDTSVAHLAGALAKPVWILLPFAPDWRWLLGTDRSKWYPTARLFRQPKPNDWASVHDQIGTARETSVSKESKTR